MRKKSVFIHSRTGTSSSNSSHGTETAQQKASVQKPKLNLSLKDVMAKRAAAAANATPTSSPSVKAEPTQITSNPVSDSPRTNNEPRTKTENIQNSNTSLSLNSSSMHPMEREFAKLNFRKKFYDLVHSLQKQFIFVPLSHPLLRKCYEDYLGSKMSLLNYIGRGPVEGGILTLHEFFIKHMENSSTGWRTTRFNSGGEIWILPNPEDEFASIPHKLSLIRGDFHPLLDDEQINLACVGRLLEIVLLQNESLEYITIKDFNSISEIVFGQKPVSKVSNVQMHILSNYRLAIKNNQYIIRINYGGPSSFLGLNRTVFENLISEISNLFEDFGVIPLHSLYPTYSQVFRKDIVWKIYENSENYNLFADWFEDLLNSTYPELKDFRIINIPHDSPSSTSYLQHTGESGKRWLERKQQLSFSKTLKEADELLAIKLENLLPYGRIIKTKHLMSLCQTVYGSQWAFGIFDRQGPTGFEAEINERGQRLLQQTRRPCFFIKVLGNGELEYVEDFDKFLRPLKNLPPYSVDVSRFDPKYPAVPPVIHSHPDQENVEDMYDVDKGQTAEISVRNLDSESVLLAQLRNITQTNTVDVNALNAIRDDEMDFTFESNVTKFSHRTSFEESNAGLKQGFVYDSRASKSTRINNEPTKKPDPIPSPTTLQEVTVKHEFVTLNWEHEWENIEKLRINKTPSDIQNMKTKIQNGAKSLHEIFGMKKLKVKPSIVHTANNNTISIGNFFEI